MMRPMQPTMVQQLPSATLRTQATQRERGEVPKPRRMRTRQAKRQDSAAT